MNAMWDFPSVNFPSQPKKPAKIFFQMRSCWKVGISPCDEDVAKGCGRGQNPDCSFFPEVNHYFITWNFFYLGDSRV